MKKYYSLGIIPIFFLFFALSCKKEENFNPITKYDSGNKVLHFETIKAVFDFDSSTNGTNSARLEKLYIDNDFKPLSEYYTNALNQINTVFDSWKALDSNSINAEKVNAELLEIVKSSQVSSLVWSKNSGLDLDIPDIALSKYINKDKIVKIDEDLTNLIERILKLLKEVIIAKSSF